MEDGWRHEEGDDQGVHGEWTGCDQGHGEYDPERYDG